MGMNTFMLIAPRICRRTTSAPGLNGGIISLFTGKGSPAILPQRSLSVSITQPTTATNSIFTHAFSQQQQYQQRQLPLPHQLLQQFKASRHQFSPLRSYGTKPAKKAQQKKIATNQHPPKSPSPPKPVGRPQVQLATSPTPRQSFNPPAVLPFERELQSQETVVYQSRNLGYSILCYGLVACSIGWSIWEYKTHILNLPPWVAQWPKFISVVAIGVVLFVATYAYWIPTRIIKSIVSVPVSRAAAGSNLNIAIRIGGWVPFTTRTITTTAQQVKLPKNINRPRRAQVNTQKVGTSEWLFARLKAPFQKLYRKVTFQDFQFIYINESRQPFLLDKEGYVWRREDKCLEAMFSPGR